MEIQTIIDQVIEKLDHESNTVRAFVGLDGYIDKIQKAVASADQKQGNQYYETLDRFGWQIQQASGKSTQIEIVSEVIKSGGNAPIMAQALASLGVPNHCVGTFGEGTIDTVFKSMHRDAELLTVGNSAMTNALEFNDGKLMLSELSSFDKVNWEHVKKVIGISILKEICHQTDLIALVDWTNLPHATDLWKGMLEDIIIPGQLDTIVFFDLCDPKKKSDEEIIEVLSLINRFGQSSKTVLGLNENEANQIYEVFKRKNGHENCSDDLMTKSQYIFEQMSIQSLIVHPIDGCYLIQQHQSKYLPGKVVAKPKISTGGGDNFNAGFCFGLLNDMTAEESMLTAIATSGAYVQYGESPTKQTLIAYLKSFES